MAVKNKTENILKTMEMDIRQWTAGKDYHLTILGNGDIPHNHQQDKTIGFYGHVQWMPNWLPKQILSGHLMEDKGEKVQGETEEQVLTRDWRKENGNRFCGDRQRWRPGIRRCQSALWTVMMMMNSAI